MKKHANLRIYLVVIRIDYVNATFDLWRQCILDNALFLRHDAIPPPHIQSRSLWPCNRTSPEQGAIACGHVQISVAGRSVQMRDVF